MHEHLKIADDERLRMIVADVLGISTHKVLAKAALGLDLHATSLDLMEIVVGVEEAFQLVIHDREVAELVFDFLLDFAEQCACATRLTHIGAYQSAQAVLQCLQLLRHVFPDRFYEPMMRHDS